MDHRPLPDFDPVYVHARRETVVLLVAFGVFLVWVVGASYQLGYGNPTDELRTVWGIPHWVFWGVGVPWMAANVFTFFFCFCYVADDPLGEPPEATNTPPEDEGAS